MNEAVTPDRTIRRRIKRWSGRGGTLRYRWYERVSDWWCASRDARSAQPVTVGPAQAGPAGVPPLAIGAWPDPDVERLGTPRTVLLGQLGRHRAEQEWIRYQAETADLQVATARATARATAADARADQAEQRLETLGDEPSAEALKAVAAGEENASTEVTTGRRRREHAVRVHAVEAEIQRHRSDAEAAKAEAVRLDTQIRIRHEVAQVRVALIEAYVRRRCSAYLTRLVRKHPDGPRLGALLRSGWTEQPSWLHGAGN